MEKPKTRIVVVCGPTASGKSALAVDVAKKLGGEIINADSMQVYKGMDIANATPSECERGGVPHHIFGIIEPSSAFSVAEWLSLARGKIAEVAARSALPVIVGGTGLYISSLIDNIIFDDIGQDTTFRNEMYALAAQRGNAFLLDMLRDVDSSAAEVLHENNTKRIVRALETYKHGGADLRTRLEKSRSESSPYDALVFGTCFSDRAKLYERINKRVDMMLAAGLLDEARFAVADFAANPTSSQAIGHKELAAYISGTETLEVCVENLKRKTRNYAKRQLTWFRKVRGLQWLLMDSEDDYAQSFDKIVSQVAGYEK